MSNFFDKALHYLGKQPQQVTALNIGAMDGVMFDEMIGYTSMYKFKVLYVEPVPYLFERLKQNITDADALFENSAISDYYGEIHMMTIDKDVIDQGLVHSCFYGMSAVFPPKNGLGSEFDRPTVEKYGKLVQVPCIPFDFLMFKHNLSAVDVIKVDAEGHDYRIFKQIDLKKYSPKVIRLEWINLTEEEQSSITTKLQEHNYVYEISGQDICAITTDLHNILYGIQEQPNTSSGVTIVTGIWNIKRDTLAEGWSRSFDHYLSHLDKLLKAPNNAIVFVQAEYVDWVWQRREKHNTLVVIKELDWFKSNESIYNKIQEIRKDAKWQNQSGWLPESTQARLEWYNPIVMSKMFLLNDAAIMDPFNSTHLVWVDGALTNTVHEGYFWHDKVVNKLEKYFNKFSFVAFPYDGKVEIHGFTYDAMCRYATGEVDKVCRGGIFGGPKDFISKANEIYYSLLAETLANGYMGTEESIFTLMLYKHPELFQYFAIEANGLLSTFFENLKNDKLQAKIQSDNLQVNPHSITNTALYVITYNSPSQFEKLCISFREYDNNFLTKPKKYLLNNSLDRSTDEQYAMLCEQYGFEEIKKDNLGICGGRQFIAEHAEEHEFDYYFFFEDDMFFYLGEEEFCRNGFRRKISSFYNTVMNIVWTENFDFLKWNFSEFFGDNTKQWAWHNVPAQTRAELFPYKPVKVTVDTNEAPFTNYKHIKSYNQLPYATGEIYYCNWPQVVSRAGSKKMFLDVKWEYPYEQTWMSYIYQETLKKNIYPGILLATPTEHNRFFHYPATDRREH